MYSVVFGMEIRVETEVCANLIDFAAAFKISGASVESRNHVMKLARSLGTQDGGFSTLDTGFADTGERSASAHSLGGAALPVSFLTTALTMPDHCELVTQRDVSSVG